jgi:hypothetical protein
VRATGRLSQEPRENNRYGRDDEMITTEMIHTTIAAYSEVREKHNRLISNLVPRLKQVGVRTSSLVYLSNTLDTIMEVAIQISRYLLVGKQCVESNDGIEEALKTKDQTTSLLYESFKRQEYIKAPKKFTALHKEVQDSLFNMMTVIPRTITDSLATDNYTAREFSVYFHDISVVLGRVSELFMEEMDKQSARYSETMRHEKTTP